MSILTKVDIKRPIKKGPSKREYYNHCPSEMGSGCIHAPHDGCDICYYNEENRNKRRKRRKAYKALNRGSGVSR